MTALLSACAPPEGKPTSSSTGAICSTVGAWLDPDTGRALDPRRLTAALANRPVVLLGENHNNAEHHRWQLQMLAALQAHKPDMIVGFEMFPRRVQPALDRWAAGELDERTFLKESEWKKVWGFDPGLYMPLFHFVRQNRLGMVGINVNRSLVSRVGREGWESIPASERAGLSTPAAASSGYQQFLADVFSQSHRRGPSTKNAPSKPTDKKALMENSRFKRFVAAQLTWDRAMAEALANARRKSPSSLVVGVMGQGHARFGYGVPHQLKDLGIPNSAVLLPMEPDEACKGLSAGIADAVFIVAPAQTIARAGPKPRLGVRLRNTLKGVLISQVVKGSVAEASGMKPRDIVISAAGKSIKDLSDLINVIGRQAPGTWLPLMIKRKSKTIQLIAKFPPEEK